jgi:hypothetical protein
MAQSWSSEDFLDVAGDLHAAKDFWDPEFREIGLIAPTTPFPGEISLRSSLTNQTVKFIDPWEHIEAESAHVSSVKLNAHADFWDPLPVVARPVYRGAVDDWSVRIPFPSYDPAASENPFSGFLQEDTQDILPEKRARWLLSMLGIRGRLPFFEDEARMLEDLISKSALCMRSDRKGAQLVDLVRKLVLEEKRKVLIFTEYRATQAYLLYMIRSLLGTLPARINGGQTAEEKLAAVQAFEDEASVLISTQAGGEGLNLHRDCHVMINYDLPWNPTKIIQRIGRLYRYGQLHKVLVFNFHARDTIDNEIVSTLVERVTTIVSEMAGVGPEFKEMGTYAADVMGDILERVDITTLLDEARSGHVARTQDRIDAAIEEARKAKAIQEEVFKGADQLDVTKVVKNYYSTEQVAQIIKRALPFVKIELDGELDAERFTLRLPVEMRGKFAEFGARTVVPVTTRRRDWRAESETVLLDFSTTFVRFLIQTITSAEFGGAYAAFADPALPEFFSVFLARYQNDQGRPQGEKLIVVDRDKCGSFEVSSRVIDKLLEGPQTNGLPHVKDASSRRSELDAAADRAEIIMAQDLSRFRHPNDLIVVAVGESAKP